MAWHLFSTKPLLNTLRPRQNGCLFADDTFKRIFLNENIRISIKISLKFVPKGLINNIPALVLIMAWRQPGDKPLSEPMMVRSLMHICVTRPQWVKLMMIRTCWCPGPLLLTWISNHTPSEIWDEIIYPSTYFNSCTVENGSIISSHTLY